MELRNYQETMVNEIAQKLSQGTRKLVSQLGTGGGKTSSFSAITHRYLKKSTQSVLILVHRIELLEQTKAELLQGFGLQSQLIVAGMKTVPRSDIYIGMIESMRNRIPEDVGLVIIDECHIANFNKIHEYLLDQLIIGFTATPISSKKNDPLKNHYDDIVCGISIAELIEQGSLCQNITYSPKINVDRGKLVRRGGEFDANQMGKEFKKPKNIIATIQAYKAKAEHSKTLIFNCSIAHSIDVHNAFIAAGYNSKYLDSTMTSLERATILDWFKNTPDAVLNNCAILTAGFNEVSIETIIFNKATLSLSLWIQCVGRGARPTPTKNSFTVIDMGGNAIEHGDWSADIDWADKFFNPNKPKNGDAPIKCCAKCDAINHASVAICKFCDHPFPVKKTALEVELQEFIMITQGLNVQRIIADNKFKKEYYPFYLIGKNLAKNAKKTVPKMSNESAEFILSTYHILAKQWCYAVGKRYNQWHQIRAKEHLYTELSNNFSKWPNPNNI